MARYEISNEVRPLDRLITGFASSCGYEIQTVFNDLLRFIIHGFSPGAPPISNWKYKRQQNASFMEMTAEWTRIMQKQIGRSGWFDAFGELHMAYCSKPGQQANGQFFTPSHICELIVQVVTAADVRHALDDLVVVDSPDRIAVDVVLLVGTLECFKVHYFDSVVLEIKLSLIVQCC